MISRSLVSYNADMNPYSIWEDEEVTLPNLEMNNGPVKVNLRQCMIWLVSDHDPCELRQDYIIKQQWPLLKMMAESETIIDIYNKATWPDDTTFEPVLDLVHKQIANHANHQQRTEGAVKGVADQSRTGVGEDRRNARLVINFLYKRELGWSKS